MSEVFGRGTETMCLRRPAGRGNSYTRYQLFVCDTGGLLLELNRTQPDPESARAWGTADHCARLGGTPPPAARLSVFLLGWQSWDS